MEDPFANLEPIRFGEPSNPFDATASTSRDDPSFQPSSTPLLQQARRVGEPSPRYPSWDSIVAQLDINPSGSDTISGPATANRPARALNTSPPREVEPAELYAASAPATVPALAPAFAPTSTPLPASGRGRGGDLQSRLTQRAFPLPTAPNRTEYSANDPFSPAVDPFADTTSVQQPMSHPLPRPMDSGSVIQVSSSTSNSSGSSNSSTESGQSNDTNNPVNDTNNPVMNLTRRVRELERSLQEARSALQGARRAHAERQVTQAQAQTVAFTSLRNNNDTVDNTHDGSSSTTDGRIPDGRPTWHCPSCTLINDDDHGRCVACNSRRPPGNSRDWSSFEGSQDLPNEASDRSDIIHQQETEINVLAEQRRMDRQQSSDSKNECVVCMDNERTAILVHETDGHQVCCIECANRLKRESKPCPVCQRGIEKVLRHFS